jgi:hypothetical protein
MAVESAYINVDHFEPTNDSYKEAETAIFKHLYKDKSYNNEIVIMNYRIFK